MTSVFISYSRTDEPFVRQLAADLRGSGIATWVDVEQISPGDDWTDSIQHGLETCDQLVIVVTPEAMDSDEVGKEWKYFLSHDKPVIPILVRPARLHYQLNSLQYVNFQGDREVVMARLLDEINGVSPILVVGRPYRRWRRLGLLLTALLLGIVIGGGVFVALPADHPLRRMIPTNTLPLAGSAVASQPTNAPATETPPVPATLTPVIVASLDTSVALDTNIVLAAPTTAPSINSASVQSGGGFPPPAPAISADPEITAFYRRADHITVNGQWSPASLYIQTIELMLVPGGIFAMGSDIATPAEAPAHLIALPPFWVMATETTNGDYQRCINAGVCSLPYPYAGFTGTMQPVVGVTWDQARRFCGWRGMRLPTEAEWEFAARGPSNWRYPFNDVLHTIAGHGQMTMTVRGASQPSWVGAQHLSGNAAEWVGSVYAAYPYTPAVESEPPPGALMGVRGGSWRTLDGLALTTTARSFGIRESQSDEVGFRCVASTDQVERIITTGVAAYLPTPVALPGAGS